MTVKNTNLHNARQAKNDEFYTQLPDIKMEKARTQAVKDFIKEHQALFWYSPGDKSETVSDELLVETILNYGTMQNVRQLFQVMGLQNVATVFRQMTGRKRLNIYPELWNYFELYFNKNVPRNF
ncbi:MAG: hypothetical protein MdMp024_1813 [Bacteroidales bacterium]